MFGRLKQLLLIFIILGISLPAAAAVKVIALKHRPASDLVDQIRGVLDPGEKVEAAGDHLVLVADGESLQAAQTLIELLDQPLTPLVIRVKQVERDLQSGEDSSAALRLSSKSGVSLEGGAARHLGNTSSQIEQSLQVLEGESGWLEVGRDIPYTSEWSAFNGKVNGYAAKIDYRRIAIGFLVRPVQVRNGQVLVDIQPQFSKQQGRDSDPPTISFSQLQTRMTIPMGQWVSLGQQLQRGDQVSRAIISWSSRRGQKNQELFIRIDPAGGFSP